MAAIGAPLFALWVIFDYRRVRARVRPMSEALAARLSSLDLTGLRAQFIAQGAFLYLPEFLDPPR